MARRGLCIGATLLGLASPVFAAGVLALDGAYGNESGCVFFATGRPGTDMVLITPDTYTFHATGCDFDTAMSTADAVAIYGVCSTPGQASVKGEILRVRIGDGQVSVIDGVELVEPLLPCITVVDPGVDA